MSNNPNADTGAGDYIEARMLAMVAAAEAGKRITDAEHVLECEPSDVAEWDALPEPPMPEPEILPSGAKLYRNVLKPTSKWWSWLWETDRAAYARWISHRLTVATDAELERIIVEARP